MNEKEKLFCKLICFACSPKEAAIRAGYKINVQKKADSLMARQDIQNKISEYNSSLNCHTGEVEAGLKRLAFGSVDDAVKLLYCDEQIPEGLDLFNVSEIKRGKNGVEIKFFDRQKALEKLSELAPASQDGAKPLYKALDESAKLLGES